MIHKTLINSDLSDVKNSGGYTVKKENWKRYHLALEKLLKKAQSSDMPDQILSDIETCLGVIGAAKEEKLVHFNDSLKLSETLCYSISLFDSVIQEWVSGGVGPVEIRDATQFRQILSFMLYEVCVFQTGIIYKSLSNNQQ